MFFTYAFLYCSLTLPTYSLNTFHCSVLFLSFFRRVFNHHCKSCRCSMLPLGIINNYDDDVDDDGDDVLCPKFLVRLFVHPFASCWNCDIQCNNSKVRRKNSKRLKKVKDRSCKATAKLQGVTCPCIKRFEITHRCYLPPDTDKRV